MNLEIFTTSRQIRRWLEEQKDRNALLPKYYTIGDFLNKIVIVEGKKFVDKHLRKLFLFEAIENINLEKLGIRKTFIDLFAESEFIFSFFEETFLEKVEIDSIIKTDTYQDYEIHLQLLKEIKEKYKEILTQKGYIDRFLIEDYQINRELLKNIDLIKIHLEGYLTKFDIEILEKIENPLEIYFDVDKFNKPLIEKSLQIKEIQPGKKYRLNLKTKELTVEKENTSQFPEVETGYFTERIHQVDFVFSKIAEFIDSGIKPESIVVVLPDKNFGEFLKLFDKYRNLNFSYGEPFVHSGLYITLKSLYECLSGVTSKCNDEILDEFKEKEITEFIKSHATETEREVIEEELFKLKIFEKFFSNKKDLLFFALERLKNLSFDDVGGGKITVMGILECRGIQFDGVIIVDFNEEFIPNIDNSDLFLNTVIRERSGLPTVEDKENLQKHYYYQLINKAKKVAISYIRNDEQSASRFLYHIVKHPYHPESNLNTSYSNVIIKKSGTKNLAEYNESINLISPIYPTALKTLCECPKKYYLKYNLKIENETEEDFFGNIFHKSVKKVLDTNKNNEDRITIQNHLEYFDKLMKEILSNLKERKTVYDIRVKWEDKIEEFCRKDFELLKKANRIETEKEIEFSIKDIQLKAVVDRIDYSDNSIILIDYKTSKEAQKSEKEYPCEFQTTFYRLWAEENKKAKTIKTLIWDIYNVELVDGNDKRNKLKKLLENPPTQSTEAVDIKDEKGKIIKKASDICKWCEYNIACGKA